MEGIYRVPGRQSRLEALRDSYDKGKPVDFEARMEDPFTCADLLLLFLRSLPEPLVPQPVSAELEGAGDNLSAVKSLLFRLPPPNRVLLSLIARHAAQVAALEASNKMGLKNVIIVFVPSLYCSPKVFSVLVSHAAELFARTCSGCGAPLAGETDVLCAACEAGGGEAEKNRGSGVRGKGALFARNSRSSNAANAGSAIAPKGKSGPPVLPPTHPPSQPQPPPQPPSQPPSQPALPSPPVSPRPRPLAHVATGPAGSVFGAPLVSGCRRQGEGAALAVVLPSVVRQCWKLVEAQLALPAGRGVYVTAAPTALLDAVVAKFDSGARVNLPDELTGPGAAQAAAALLLRYIASLPAPLFSLGLSSAFEKAVGSPGELSVLVFKLSLEERTFLLHLVSHVRTVVKHEAAPTEELLAAMAAAGRCSAELLGAVYANRRSIMQPNCLACEKIVQLNEQPVFDGLQVTCQACAGKKG
jgi:hypothetical protein